MNQLSLESRFSPEFTLLTLCVGRRPNELHQVSIRRLVSPTFDWDCFLALAQRHRIVPLAFFLLSRNDEDVVPPLVVERLRRLYQANAQRNLHLAGELARIAQAFDEQGVPLLAFKGPVLANDVYGGLACRQFRDLDVLVRPADLISAVAILSELGYAGEGLPLLQTSPVQRKRLVRAHKHVTLLRKAADREICVELHWRLAEFKHSFTFPSSRLWDSSSKTCLGGTMINTIPFPEQIVFLAYHGGMHRWKRLLWLCDLSLALRHVSNLDWDELFSTAAKLGAERYLHLGLIVLHQLTPRHDSSCIWPHEIETLLLRKQRTWQSVVDSVYQAMLEDAMYYERKPLSSVAWCFRLSRGVLPKLSSLGAMLTPRPEALLQFGYGRSTLQRFRRLATRCLDLFRPT